MKGNEGLCEQINMALKLGKCRLCLKLGDFYSIFTVDNNLQLAEMVMECARVKICEGDGLPDKICSECIQKLSSAHIFKQQCERSDQELRRNYILPPGFIASTPGQSSEEQSKPSPSFEGKVTPVPKSRKRSRDSIDNVSIGSRNEYQPGSSKRVDELRQSQKKLRFSTNSDSECEDHHSGSVYSGGTDSDEPLLHKCDECGKAFKSALSAINHKKSHRRLQSVQVEEEPKEIQVANDSDDKLSCDKCGKEFKLNIMLKRHYEICPRSPRKELMMSLEPIDAVQQSIKIDCQMCTTKFKTNENLEKHMKVVHAAILKKEDTTVKNENGKICVPCFYCGEAFEDYYIHSAHFNFCPQKTDTVTFECTVCNKVITKKGCCFLHLKAHFFSVSSCKTTPEPVKNNFQCRMCNKKLPSPDSLITHLASHMTNMDEADDGGDEESRLVINNYKF